MTSIVAVAEPAAIPLIVRSYDVVDVTDPGLVMVITLLLDDDAVMLYIELG